MPTCFLHAGTHKTGTSALQRFAADNDALLRDCGILYPKTSRWRTGTHWTLTNKLFTELTTGQSSNTQRALRQEIEAAGKPKLLISSEGLEDGFKTGAFEKVVEFFRSLGYEIHVLMFFRNQPQYINSQYVQRSKMLLLNTPFEEFCKTEILSPTYDYGKIADTLERLRVETTFWPYNTETHEYGIHRRMFEAIVPASALADMKPMKLANTAPGPITVAVAQNMLRRFQNLGITLTIPQSNRCQTLLIEPDSQQPLYPESVPYCGLNNRSATKIQEAFAAKNDAFALRYWTASWEQLYAKDVQQEFRPNKFSRTNSSESDIQSFESILEDVWPKAQRIVRETISP